MKKIFTLLCIFALSLITVSVRANTVTVDGATGTTSKYLPVALHTTTTNANYAFHSVSQQLYYASELTEASSNEITAISFDYVGTTMNDRKIAVWMNSVSYSSFPLPNEENLADAANETPNMVDPGKRVFSGEVAMVDGKTYTITFDTPYEWNGTSNIIVTVLDSTAKKMTSTNYGFGNIKDVKVRIFETSGKVRFLHKTSKDESDYASKGWDMNNLAASQANTSSVDNRKYANRITFTFAAPAAVVPAVPEDLAATNVGSTTASLSWTAVDGATSYNLYYSASAEGPYLELASPTTNSYNWTGLTYNTTFYVKVAAVNATGSSDLSSYIYFTTLAPHEHDGITFEPWSNASAMPTSGDYYLANDVALDPYEPSTITLTGNLNLCLNGNTANLYGSKIVVPDDKTLAIYDNIGGGKITGFVASEVGAFDIYAKALIAVYSGGTLILKQGTIENTYIPDEDGQSYAIYSNGSMHLSGGVLINSNSADIYLYASNKITLDGAISNAEKHTVYKAGGDFTDGWSTYMSGENPRDYFASANSARSVCLNAGEASLRLLLNLSESSLNSSIGTSSGQVADVNLTRSLTSSQYNTFCLPFALSNAQLQAAFGSGYDLEEFVEASLDGDQLSLTFNKVTSLTAGKPYLLQPSVDVVNPSFEGVTIGVTAPADQTSDTYISFHGTFAPTELQGGNKNLLFLGAGNELFWPDSDGDLKGFRAYFEVKGGAAKVAKRARIVNKEDSATGIENINQAPENQKFILNGQLYIRHNGAIYNIQGQRL